MKKYIFLFTTISLLLCACSSDQVNDKTEKNDFETPGNKPEGNVEYVEFSAEDGLIVSGQLHEFNPEKTMIILCHQSGLNLHEYDSIIPELITLGYSCLAIDQRAGGVENGFSNLTVDRALDQRVNMGMIEAKKDIEAAIRFAKKKSNNAPIIWGSSYSASHVLSIAQEQDEIHAVVAFSPGDYFEKDYPKLSNTLKNLTLPFFITCAKNESEAMSKLLTNKTLSDMQYFYNPTKNGQHGSSALNPSTNGSDEYWQRLKKFLRDIK
ncbi:alpha/beta hydrolase [Crocinitomix algicola]|uniref:alpha/beta hydrolase n=1 Tax=Crocinitomix algicola TaxID=1740263 RepID=UPI0011130057|nr:alpha/beta hydrolase [Crocinitomix algicola]